MKTKTLIFVSIIVCLLLTSLMLVNFTFAWFADTRSSSFSATTSIQRSYFESGDGNAPVDGWEPATYNEQGNLITGGGISGPFEIHRPIQLYYFAWLQQLGYFNKTNDNGEIKQYYFYLSNDLDMTNLVLPPIGSDSTPFVGNFNGNGHVISNLNVINDQGNLSDIPEGGKGGNQIIGFFGVIGGQNATVSDGTATVTIGGHNYTYSSSVNEVKNFGLNSVTISSQTPTDSKTLVGIVAGYVNASVRNVAVCNSTIAVNSGIGAVTDITGNLSDFSLVGFCEDAYKDSLYAENIRVFEPTLVSSVTSTTDGGENDWGGSIDMLNIYKRLYHVLKGSGTSSYTVSDTHIFYDAQGNMIGSKTAANNTDGSGKRYYDVDMGSYIGWNRDNVGVDVTTTNNYNLLQGKPFMVYEYRPTTGVADAAVISSGNNYLSATVSGTSYNVTNQTSLADTTLWQFSNGKLSTTLNGSTRYLSCSNGTLTVNGTVQSSATTWTYNAQANTFYCVVGEKTYYLTCINSGWSVVTHPPVAYQIAYGSNYLTTSGTSSITNTTNASSAAIWSFSDNDTGYLSTVIDGRTYYLNRSAISGLTLGTTTSTTWTKDSSNHLYYTNILKRYLYYNNGWVTGTTTQALTFSAVEQPFTPPTISMANYTVESHEYYDAAYIPLAVNNPTATTVNVDNYGVAQKNTGYIVGGSQYQGDDKNADIRVSIFTKSYIQSYINSANKPIWSRSRKDHTLQAINAADIAEKLKLQKFTSSFGDANSGFSGMISQAAYGLHFMDAQISKDKLVNTEKVVFDRVTMYNYQMPISSIDFALSTNGYINFYAGSYFNNPNNTSFCSLHEIIRNKDTLSKTKSTVLMAYISSNENAPIVFKSANGGYYTYQANDYKAFTVDDTFDVAYTQAYKFVYMNPQNTLSPLYYEDEDGILFTLENGVFVRQQNLPVGYEDINTLKDIKEIDKVFGVYKNDVPVASIDFIYLYSDGTWSDGAKDRSNSVDTFTKDGQNFELAFDLNWVKKPEAGMNPADGNIHYYEIPVNSGEYALGSVEGETGAYILYLDLSSNAQRIHRTTVTDVTESTTTEYVYPKGVQFVEKGQSYSSDTDSVTLTLPNSLAGGSVTFSRNGNTMIHNGASPYNTTLVGMGMTFQNGGADVPLHTRRVIVTIETVKQYDYNLSTLEETVTSTITTQTTTIEPDGTSMTTRTAKTVDAGGKETIIDSDGHTIILNNIAVELQTVLPSSSVTTETTTLYRLGRDGDGKADHSKTVDMTLTITSGQSLALKVLTKENGCKFIDGEAVQPGTTAINVNNVEFDVGDTISITP